MSLPHTVLLNSFLERRGLLRQGGHQLTVDGFHISNFRGFPTDFNQHIKLSPLTLLYGLNNSGKSTIVRALASFGQTMSLKRSAPTRASTIEWASKGEWFDLGSATQFLHKSGTQGNQKDEFTLGIVFNQIFPDNSDSVITTDGMEDKVDPDGLRLRLDYRIQTIDNLESSCLISGFTLSESTDSSNRFKPLISGSRMPENAQKKQRKILDRMEDEFKGVPFMRHSTWDHDVTYTLKIEDAGLRRLFNKRKKLLKTFCEMYKRWVLTDTKATGSEDDDRAWQEHRTTAHTMMRIWPRIPIEPQEWREHMQKNRDEGGLGIPVSDEELDIVKELFLRPHRTGSGEPAEDVLTIYPVGFHILTSLHGMNFFKGYKPSMNMHTKNPFKFSFSSTTDISVGREIELFTDFVYNISHNFALWCSNMDHLSPRRMKASRYYDLLPGGTTTQGSGGEYTPSNLYKDPDLASRTNAILQKVLGLQVKVHPLFSRTAGPEDTEEDDEAQMPLLDLRVGNAGETKFMQLPDVGFGVSQLLPLAASICQNIPESRSERRASSNTLLVEEPESNLHPVAQGRLMEAIVETLFDKPRGDELWNVPQLILETHSEHFLNQLLKLMKEKKIPDDLVSIHYVDSNEGVTRVTHIRTKDGVPIVPWPRDTRDDPTYTRI